MALSHAQYDLLERAVARGQRLAVTRRGSTWIVVAERLDIRSGTERLISRHPSTGESLTFDVDEIERLEVVT